MGIRMRMNKGEISLDGYGRRKSFYGKCGVRESGGVKFLRSYDTVNYAAAYGGYLVRLSDRWSATSSEHLNAFANFACVEYHGKNGTYKNDPYAWGNLPTVEHNYLFSYLTDSEMAETVRKIVERIKQPSAA